MSRNKSTQKSAKGTPLGNPILRRPRCFSFVSFAARGLRNALRLPRSPAAAVLLCSFIPLLWCALRRGREHTNSCHSRHSFRKGRNLVVPPQERVSGANDSPFRSASAANYNDEPIPGPRKRGYIRGYPLCGVLGTFSPRKKYPAGGRTGFRQDDACLRQHRTVKSHRNE